MTNLSSMLNSRDITLPAKIHIVKPYGLPNGRIRKEESLTVKKAECQRTDVFKEESQTVKKAECQRIDAF